MDQGEGSHVGGSARVDDLELAARLVAGEPAALADAYESYGGLVFGLARRVLRDAAMAEEVTQEVFILLWEHPERFDPARGQHANVAGPARPQSQR